MNSRFSVIIIPLDWGLGHATRCIPLIQAFLKRDWNVLIATSGGALQLLKLEFPQLTFFEIVSYQAEYATSGRLLPKLAIQSYKFFSAMRREHKQLEQILLSHPVDLIISDNRFGCYSKKVKSIFVTHQLQFVLRFPYNWASMVVNFWNRKRIKRFHECWIPDLPDRPFSGVLSLDSRLPVFFVGPLSRFIPSTQKIDIEYDVLVLLSGPEPQRTILEELISRQLASLDLRAIVVQGLPQKGETVNVQGKVKKVSHLRQTELQHVIEASQFVVCRSGYSSILDLAALKKKNLIMIPTPGQPEQEYLADFLMANRRVYAVDQKDFDLGQALERSSSFLGLNCGEVDDDLLSRAIDRLMLLHKKNQA